MNFWSHWIHFHQVYHTSEIGVPTDVLKINDFLEYNLTVIISLVLVVVDFESDANLTLMKKLLHFLEKRVDGGWKIPWNVIRWIHFRECWWWFKLFWYLLGDFIHWSFHNPTPSLPLFSTTIADVVVLFTFGSNNVTTSAMSESSLMLIVSYILLVGNVPTLEWLLSGGIRWKQYEHGAQ